MSKQPKNKQMVENLVRVSVARLCEIMHEDENHFTDSSIAENLNRIERLGTVNELLLARSIRETIQAADFWRSVAAGEVENPFEI